MPPHRLLVSLALCIAAPAVAAEDVPHRATWGILAEMVGHDYYETEKGKYPYGAYRFEWVRPGEEMRIVRFYGEKPDDCRLAVSAEGLKGQCVNGKGRETPLSARVDADQTVVLTSTIPDMLGLKTKANWGRFRRSEKYGGFELRIEKLFSRPLVEVSTSTIELHKTLAWLPKALAELGPIANGAPAAETLAPPPPPPADDSPPV